MKQSRKEAGECNEDKANALSLPYEASSRLVKRSVLDEGKAERR
jgi:hypothetical protein